jgi:hypothetical protein
MRSCLCSFGLFAHLVKKNMKRNGRTQRKKKKGGRRKRVGMKKHLDVVELWL